MSESPIQLRGKSGGVVFQGTQSPGGGSLPAGAAWVFPFANAGAADDAKGSNGDLALLLDTGTFIQKAGGTWATS